MIFVTGYFGASIREEADRIAACKGWPVLDLDRAIEEADGRSIARLCMMGGEHAYRNAEYEQLQQLCGAETDDGIADDPGSDHGEAGDREANDSEAVVTKAADGPVRAAACDPKAIIDKVDIGKADVTTSAEEGAGLVVACGDGILHDEDSRALILRHQLVIAGEDQPLEELWEHAKQETGTYHAFMKFGSEEERREKFREHHDRQRTLFAKVRGEMAEDSEAME